MPRKPPLQPGREFGRWVVIDGPIRVGERNVSHYRCRCRCGTVKLVYVGNLKRGGSKGSQSCGCLRRETSGRVARKHGGSKTRLHRIWQAMRARCRRPGHASYADYGGRGIVVCEQWRESFPAFRDWATASGYADHLSIDRKDNDGPYSPENCRWSDGYTQASNKRNNRLLTIWGETKHLSEWSRDPRCRVVYFTLHRRLAAGWSPEDAMTVRFRKPPRRLR